MKRWNFLKANWKRWGTITNNLAKKLPLPDARNANTAYQAFFSMTIKAAKQCVPRGKRKLYILCWDKECEILFQTTQVSTGNASDLAVSSLITRLDNNRRTRWEETVQNIDFTHSSRKAWRTINKLTGRCRPPLGERSITANAIASQLVNNGTYPTGNKDMACHVSKEVSELWKILIPPDHNISEDFSDNELTSALDLLKPGKAPGPDHICSEFILYGGKALKSWLREFLSSGLRHLKIPKFWRRADVVAIPKPNKLLDDARSYSPISLLCVPYKILERLIHSRIEPVIDPHLPPEEAGFRQG